MKTMTAANTIVWHSLKHNLKAKQGKAASRQRAVSGVEGKHTAICIFLWRQEHWGYFASCLSIPMALMTSQPSPLPQPSLTIQSNLCSTESGAFSAEKQAASPFFCPVTELL